MKLENWTLIFRATDAQEKRNETIRFNIEKQSLDSSKMQIFLDDKHENRRTKKMPSLYRTPKYVYKFV